MFSPMCLRGFPMLIMISICLHTRLPVTGGTCNGKILEQPSPRWQRGFSILWMCHKGASEVLRQNSPVSLSLSLLLYLVVEHVDISPMWQPAKLNDSCKSKHRHAHAALQTVYVPSVSCCPISMETLDFPLLAFPWAFVMSLPRMGTVVLVFAHFHSQIHQQLWNK